MIGASKPFDFIPCWEALEGGLNAFCGLQQGLDKAFLETEMPAIGNSIQTSCSLLLMTSVGTKRHCMEIASSIVNLSVQDISRVWAHNNMFKSIFLNHKHSNLFVSAR